MGVDPQPVRGADPSEASRVFAPAPLEKLAQDNLELARRASDAETRNADLERRLQERTMSLATAMKDLEAFSYSVSHDLRAPLRGIIGFSHALAAEHGAGLDPEGRRLLDVVRREARQMGQLIDDLLAFVRAGRQALDPDSIDMTDLARSALQQLTENAATGIPAVEVRALPRSHGDRALIRQVFHHLLGNAIKFSRQQPIAQVAVTGWAEGDWSTYCVADNGVGFNPAQAPRLFGIFQRLHRHEDFEGSGVGLALVQRIVQRHGGRIWAEGTAGGGAKFFFTLPGAHEHST